MTKKLQFTIGLPCRNRVKFCNEALKLMLKNSNYPIIVIDDNSDMPDAKYLKDKRITIIYNTKKTGIAHLWNMLIKASQTENVIICSDKIRMTKKDFELIDKKLKQGYGVVTTNLFHILAFSKYLTTKIGFMDEGFVNCNYEDCDLQRRLFVNDIALYFTQESKVMHIPSGWARNDKGENKRYYQRKWIEDNKHKKLILLHDEKNYEDRKYYDGKYENIKYLPWSKSVIKIKSLKNYFNETQFIDKRNKSDMSNVFYILGANYEYINGGIKKLMYGIQSYFKHP